MKRERSTGHVAQSIPCLKFILLEGSSESPRCSVEESTGEKGSACSLGRQ